MNITHSDARIVDRQLPTCFFCGRPMVLVQLTIAGEIMDVGWFSLVPYTNECQKSVLAGCHEPDDPAPVMKTGLLDVLRDLAEP